jgi:exodeoxyribonuclease VII small subunit
MSTDDGTTSPKTFKEAFGVLQRHADTLRRQQDPNIDELVNIVTESVSAYRVCKERIQAVELALQRTLGEAEEGSSGAALEASTEGRLNPVKSDEGPVTTQSSPAREENAQTREDFDDDIPF